VETALYTPPNWIEPLHWQSVFSESRPIEVDVGCGKGGFLLWAAQTQPDRNFFGVERLLLRLRKVDKKIRRLCLPNARLIRIEASYLIAKLIPESSVSVYHIYFPDPWPKRRHHRRRLFTPAFVADLRRTLQPGGAVNVATDQEDYFREIGTLMRESGFFVAEPPLSLPDEARTEFEREFLTTGKPVFRGRWKKAVGV
jgi:tRNA (guanine-N7-)-methyltransferase